MATLTFLEKLAKNKERKKVAMKEYVEVGLNILRDMDRVVDEGGVKFYACIDRHEDWTNNDYTQLWYDIDKEAGEKKVFIRLTPEKIEFEIN